VYITIWNKTPKAKIYLRQYQHRYRQVESERVKFLAEKYRKSEKGKATWRRGRQRYSKTEQGKIAARRKDAKRRSLKFIILLNNPFPEEVKVDWHHINDLFVIPVPKRLHNFYSSNYREKHRSLIMKKIKKFNLLKGLEEVI